MRRIIILCGLLLMIRASFAQQLVVHFNTTPTNGVDVTVLSNSTANVTGFMTDNGAEAPEFFAVEPSIFTNAFSWTFGAETVTNGGGMLAIDIGREGNTHLRVDFNAVYDVISGGFFFCSTATNPGTAYLANETFYITRPGGDSVTALLVVQTNKLWFRAHGAGSQNGTPIVGISPGDTNWISWRAYKSNMVVAVYNPATWTQIGTNSTINWTPHATLPGFDRIRLNSWDIPEVMPTKTNYSDSWLITTNDAFPYFPTGSTNPPLSEAYVQSLIDSATPNSTVLLPAGTATWTTNVIIDRKPITLLGHASGTWITNSQVGELGSGVDDGGVAIRVNGTSNGVTRISQINIVGNPNRGNGIYVRGDKWSAVRIDHCTFLQTGHGAIDFWEMISGVVDHCVFKECRSTVNSYALDHMNNSWTNALTLGTTNAIVVEANVVNYTTAFTNTTIGVCSQGLGGRSVWRYNYVTNTTTKFMRFVDAHGNQARVDTSIQPTISGTTNSHRGTRQCEVYGNVVNASGGGTFRLSDFRGGVIICDGNTFLGADASSTFRAREEDAPYDNNFVTTYPGMDQHWLYFWENTSKGTAISALDFANAGDAVFLVNNVNVFWSAPAAGTGLVQSYTPLIYPHPLVSAPVVRNFRIQGKQTFSGNAKVN